MKRLAIGMMTGTSLDGIDLVLVEIEDSSIDTITKVLSSKTYAYEAKLLEKIRTSMEFKNCTPELLCSLNYELAKAYAECVFDFTKVAGFSAKSIDFIASHGQTIYHITDNANGYHKSSLQLGNGSVLANLTGIDVISDFRSADIAVGGQGAPLVPYAHYVLFHDKEKSRIIQNIGGISNLTYLPANADLNQVIAFDNGPGNMKIDRAMQALYGKPFDYNGDEAKKGKVIKPLFLDVINMEYFTESYLGMT